mmetsp:Transcript_12987/g.29901  ORF Transcript_12987/g.29901 Transcript_12987/m.29901 type:complete len:126 (-) Transcript_12987:299-676(-)|eukprot:CAMPEP_0119353396 /NCGR_PEP_ID=MMETSP1334-20130426/2546_1 /TAXON_ID=127549 /ORGANISM="Calcidiscus leptoporus, Strain RCC1130" /LENGTH=125 /DNA_ID=CAMNT_0007366667 /DNA_START=35 /DNA_END=412 /DNA_ORIENTATION=+
MADWARRELDAQLAEACFGLSLTSAAQIAGCGAEAAVCTLEGAALTLRLDEGGVRVVRGASSVSVLAAPDAEACGMVYDSVNSLLLNVSKKFVQAFNSSLAAALQVVAQQREAEGAREEVGGETA